MSVHEVPPFDALAGGGGPYEGFGPVMRENELARPIQSVADQALQRIREVFQCDISVNRSGIAALEGLIQEMWMTGWSPEGGDVNLFARDFGTILLLALHRELGGECLFRSSTNLSHASVWWRDIDLEAFPFHRVLKALLRSDTESLTFFFDGLSKRVLVRNVTSSQEPGPKRG